MRASPVRASTLAGGAHICVRVQPKQARASLMRATAQARSQSEPIPQSHKSAALLKMPLERVHRQSNSTSRGLAHEQRLLPRSPLHLPVRR
eukprot:1428223-Pleurochrysis_carterae.AAC.4